VPGAAHLKKPDTDIDAELPVHRGAAAFIDGNERTFLDRYSDYFWFAILLLSGFGSAGAWFRHYLKRDEREDTTIHRNKIMAVISGVRTAESTEELLAMQREVDAIIHETLKCDDDGAIDEEDLAAFGLVKEAKDLLPADDQREKAIAMALDSASTSAKIAEAEMAKALGYELCKCQFPPTPMLTIGHMTANPTPATSLGKPVFECPRCGNNNSEPFGFQRTIPRNENPPA
jgi:hypothetical protein